MGLVRRTGVAVTALLAVVGFVSSWTMATSESGAAAIPPVCIPGEVTVPVTADASVSKRHPNRRYGTTSRWKVNDPDGSQNWCFVAAQVVSPG